MKKLLDCTLRDGGYINNWNFGQVNIRTMKDALDASGADIVELGFLKNESYDPNRTVFNRIEQIESLAGNMDSGREYAAMIEVMNPIPIEELSPYNGGAVDIIRVIVWKDIHDEYGNKLDALRRGFEYCKGIVERGYKLFVQPARVDQYSDEEFIDMLNMFKELSPTAIYVVDSWGTLSGDAIMHYVSLADQTLPEHIAIGYHGHNNLMQAFGAAVDFLKYDFSVDRDIIVDASVYGIGRCAGNLNSEVIAHYMNNAYQKEYNISPMIKMYEDIIRYIYDEHKWGYCMPYFITAQYGCHPNYGYYYGFEKGFSQPDLEGIISSLEGDDRILYCKETADKYEQRYRERQL